jgi:hypothetical protein
VEVRGEEMRGRGDESGEAAGGPCSYDERTERGKHLEWWWCASEKR